MSPTSADPPRRPARRPRLAVVLAAMLALAVALAGQIAVEATGDDGSASTAGGPSIRPDPANASSSRGRLPRDGCFLGRGETTSPRCVYGDPSSDRRAVLFGDSHAMHYYPGLNNIVRQRGWRLVVLTKAGCPPMYAVKRGSPGERTECSAWRRSALRRIERREAPDLVITGASVNYRVFDANGEPLGDARAESALRSSYIDVLRRLRRTGARLTVMKDVPKASFDVPSCVDRFRDRPGRCAFSLPENHGNRFDTRAARSTNARLVSVTPSICAERCRAVIARILVYRAGSHLTAHFARTLREPLARQLPHIR